MKIVSKPWIFVIASVKIRRLNCEKKIELKEKAAKVEEINAVLRSIIAEKNIEIENLQQNASQIENRNVAPVPTFETCVDVLSREQINHLKTIETTSRADSTFVGYILKCLYAENLNVVANKSSCGRKNKNKPEQKEAMTPEKKKILTDMYAERLQCCAKNATDKIVRKKNLNKLI